MEKDEKRRGVGVDFRSLRNEGTSTVGIHQFTSCLNLMLVSSLQDSSGQVASELDRPQPYQSYHPEKQCPRVLQRGHFSCGARVDGNSVFPKRDGKGIHGTLDSGGWPLGGHAYDGEETSPETLPGNHSRHFHNGAVQGEGR